MKNRNTNNPFSQSTCKYMLCPKLLIRDIVDNVPIPNIERSLKDVIITEYILYLPLVISEPLSENRSNTKKLLLDTIIVVIIIGRM